MQRPGFIDYLLNSGIFITETEAKENPANMNIRRNIYKNLMK